MFTPIEIQNHSLKTSVRGYSKKETDDFLEEILRSYEELYKENRDLKDKVNSLSEGIQYYKNMETTLQKALVLAEKTSSETQEAARSKADSLMSETQAKVAAMQKKAEAEIAALRKETEAYSEVTRAKVNQELAEAKENVRKLVRSYENYRLQFIRLAESQIEMLESDHYKIFEPEISEMFMEKPVQSQAATNNAPTEEETRVPEKNAQPESAVHAPENHAQSEAATHVPENHAQSGEASRVPENHVQSGEASRVPENHAQSGAASNIQENVGGDVSTQNSSEQVQEEKAPDFTKILGDPPLVLGNDPIPDTVPLPVEELRAIMASIPEIPLEVSVTPDMSPMPDTKSVLPQPLPVQEAVPQQASAQQPQQIPVQQPQQPPVQQQTSSKQAVSETTTSPIAGRQLTADDMPPIPSADDMPPILPNNSTQNSPFTFIDPE